METALIIADDTQLELLFAALWKAKYVSFDTETETESEAGGLGHDRLPVGCSIAWAVPAYADDPHADLDDAPLCDCSARATIHSVYVPLRHLTPQKRTRITKKTPKQIIPSDEPVVSVGKYMYTVGPQAVVNVKPELFFEEFTKILMRKDLVLVMHNAKFDMHVLRNEGVDIDAVQFVLEDTMLINFLLDATSGGNKLKVLAKSIFDHDMTHIEQFKVYYGNERTPIPEMALYAADDTRYTLHLYFYLRPQLDDKKNADLLKAYYELEMPICRLVERMENTGFMLDTDLLNAAGDKLLAEEQTITARIAEMLADLLNGGEVKLSSPPWLSDKMIDEWCLWAPNDKRGKSGKYSTDAEYLNAVVARQVPGCTLLGIRVAKEMLWLRKLAKMRGTYTHAMVERLAKSDGRLHCSFNQMGAATGRFCVLGDTLLHTESGVVRIDDPALMVPGAISVLTHTGAYRPVIAQVFKGYEEAYEVRLASGGFVRCTANHRIRTERGWQSLKELWIGDHACVAPAHGFCDAGLETSPIVSIRYIGRHRIWDVTVDTDHSYVSGGLAHHNSSSDPNLQNIPRYDERLPNIRSAFVAKPGFVLVDADYSQIELRLLAHYSMDPTMLGIYRDNGDIHAITAKLIGSTRQQAKPVNFGVIYGKQAPNLAETLEVSLSEAKRFLQAFFDGYPLVRPFMDRTVRFLRENGYVTTLIGRRRPIPDSNSESSGLRAHAERQAVNTRIQGSASDLMKIAMRNVQNRLRRDGLLGNAEILSQVHDELILEVREDLAETVRDLVKYEMEHAVTLAVPLVSEPSIGKNWAEAK